MDTLWVKRVNELEDEWVKLQIQHNGWYEKIKEDFKNNESIVWSIRKLWTYYQEYSLYTIMDSIEEFMEEHKIKSVDKAISHKDFEIKVV